MIKIKPRVKKMAGFTRGGAGIGAGTGAFMGSSMGLAAGGTAIAATGPLTIVWGP